MVSLTSSATSSSCSFGGESWKPRRDKANGNTGGSYCIVKNVIVVVGHTHHERRLSCCNWDSPAIRYGKIGVKAGVWVVVGIALPILTDEFGKRILKNLRRRSTRSDVLFTGLSFARYTSTLCYNSL